MKKLLIISFLSMVCVAGLNAAGSLDEKTVSADSASNELTPAFFALGLSDISLASVGGYLTGEFSLGSGWSITTGFGWGKYLFDWAGGQAFGGDGRSFKGTWVGGLLAARYYFSGATMKKGWFIDYGLKVKSSSQRRVPYNYHGSYGYSEPIEHSPAFSHGPRIGWRYMAPGMTQNLYWDMSAGIEHSILSGLDCNNSNTWRHAVLPVVYFGFGWAF